MTLGHFHPIRYRTYLDQFYVNKRKWNINPNLYNKKIVVYMSITSKPIFVKHNYLTSFPYPPTWIWKIKLTCGFHFTLRISWLCVVALIQMEIYQINMWKCQPKSCSFMEFHKKVLLCKPKKSRKQDVKCSNNNNNKEGKKIEEKSKNIIVLQKECQCGGWEQRARHEHE